MSRSINRSNLVAVRNVTLVVVGVAGVWGLVGFLRQFGRSDPFAALHQKQTVDPFGSMTLKDVEMKHYKGDKLTTRATVKEVAVRRDRQFYDLQGITHGLYQSDRGPLLFAASKGTWDQYRGLLTAKEQVRIANKDFDVQTPMAYFDAKQQTVKMPATLSGRLFKGDIKAASLVFNTSTHDILVKKPSYVGPAVGLQEDSAPKTWQLEGDEVNSRGDLIVYTNGQGTDGDIIVRGSKIEQNRKTDVLTVTGRVEYYSGAANMTCDQAVIYRKEKRAVLSGNVTMLIKPKADRDKGPKIEVVKPFKVTPPDSVVAGRPQPPKSQQEKDDLENLRDPKNIREYPMIVRADTVEYFYRKGQRHANIGGSPQAKQDLPRDRWRQIWADKGYWDGEKELLTLSTEGEAPKVRMKNSTGDDLFAVSFTVSTKEEDESYTGKKIKGGIVDLGNDEVDEATKKNEKATDTTPPATTPPPVKQPDQPADKPVDKPVDKPTDKPNDGGQGSGESDR